ncbi:hypothetical protein BaRGS_00032521 [Batillaria attramentaria]|uniref:Uncharacterized protein n=1 Tax=Batillaria attramentaria TaxID=370345 RepID=A0ABD0JNJ6_9CAEN
MQELHPKKHSAEKVGNTASFCYTTFPGRRAYSRKKGKGYRAPLILPLPKSYLCIHITESTSKDKTEKSVFTNRKRRLGVHKSLVTHRMYVYQRIIPIIKTTARLTPSKSSDHPHKLHYGRPAWTNGLGQETTHIHAKEARGEGTAATLRPRVTGAREGASRLQVAFSVEGRGERHVVECARHRVAAGVRGHALDAVLGLIRWQLLSQDLGSDVRLQKTSAIMNYFQTY